MERCSLYAPKLGSNISPVTLEPEVGIRFVHRDQVIIDVWDGRRDSSISNIPYSALFSRRLNFEVFADLILPAKIAPSKLT